MKNKFLLALLFIIIANATANAQAFITKWNTANTSLGSEYSLFQHIKTYVQNIYQKQTNNFYIITYLIILTTSIK